MDRWSYTPLLQKIGSKYRRMPPTSACSCVWIWHSYEFDVWYLPQLTRSLKGTEIILSLTDIVISSFISVEVISKGFLVLPMSLRKDGSGWKLVEKELIVNVCVETSERVTGRGGKRGYLQGSSMMIITPSLCLNYSLMSVASSDFLKTSKKMFDSCNPMTPKASSSTAPGLIL